MRFKRLKALKIAIQSAWRLGIASYKRERRIQEELIDKENKKVFK